MTQQPIWKCVGHIGDIDPIAYGGGFVYQDETGVYPPEMVWFEPTSDEQWHKTEGATPVEIYRLVLEPARFKTFLTGQYDRDKLKDPQSRDIVWHWYKEWFVRDLASVAESCGTTWFTMARGLMSKDPMERAQVYYDLIHYHGAHNFDAYPLTMTEDEAYERYAMEMKSTKGLR